METAKTITIQKREKSAKNSEKIDWELVESFKRSLEDLKAGRIKRVR